MKKNSALLCMVLALASTSILAGCDNAQDDANKIQGVLGMPVTMNADKNDSCVIKQLSAFINTYNSYADDEKAEYIKDIKAEYDSITVNPSATTQTTTGKIILFQKTDSPCDGSGNCTVYDTKTILNTVAVTGTAPLTQIDRGDTSVGVTLQNATDTSEHEAYSTQSYTDFTDISSFSDPEFAQNLQNQQIRQTSDVRNNSTTCSPLADLADLL